MTDTMIHRGPDDAGYHLDERVAIGARRLSIIDVQGGHQPFYNEDGRIVAAQNGELYNHVGLRRQLEGRGHIFRTRCDTEILPHLFEECGTGVPDRLLGMFAFVIFDAEEGRCILVRDRLGIKPLYYAEVGDLLVFGSELKSVVASGLVPLDVDYDRLDLYLSLGFVPGPGTLLRNVKKLLPGERLVVEPPTSHVEKYWQYPEPAWPEVRRSEAALTEELVALLEDAVRLRLMSDVPLGAMLSGGLDSAVVVALMARSTSQPVKTFSVGFVDAAENELAEARQTARCLGTEHHELELSLDDPVDFEELIWSLDEPVADLSSLGFSALSALTAQHVTVALSGQGADELFAGYSRYSQIALVDRLASAPGLVRRAAASLGSLGNDRARRATAVVAAADPVGAAIRARSEWSDESRARGALGPLGAVSGGAFDEMLAARLRNTPARGVARALMLDGQLNLVDDMLHYFDRMSMAHSLEVRVPFLDHRLVEFAASVPTSLKLRRGATKYLLRSAVRGLVPDEVLTRPKVGFFSSAVGEWFERQIHGPVGEMLTDPAARYAEFVDRAEVLRLIASPRKHRSSHLLLTLLMLELWLSSFLPRATRSPRLEGIAL